MGQSFKPLLVGLTTGLLLGTGAFAVIHFGLNRGPVRPTVADFSLQQINGVQTRLYDHAAAKAIVLCSHGIGCPIVRQGIAKLNAIKEKVGNTDLFVLMINANPQDSVEDIQRELHEMGSSLSVVKDVDQKVIKALGIQRTGHVMVIQPKTWTLEYSGALDGERLGQDPSTEQKFLEDALSDLASGQSPRIRESAVTGCVIGS